MAKTAVEFSQDWELWEMKIDPKKFTKAFEKRVKKATVDNCLYLVRKIKERILTTRSYAKNAPLTIMLKGSDRPLVDHGDMVKFISHELIDSFSAFVGARKSKKGVNIAEMLHEGGVYKMTPEQRQFIAIAIGIAMKKRGTEGKAVPESKHPGYVVIPSRPFIREVVWQKRVQTRIINRWKKAFQSTLEKE